MPIRTSIRPPSPASPNVCSPRTAVLASLATKTGTSNAARSPSASGVPCQPRLGASTTTPSASTTPGVPTPMPSTGRVAASTSSRTMVVDEGDGVLAAAPLERLATPLLDVTREVEQGPGDDPVRGEVDRNDLAGLPGQLDQHRGLADPALDRGRGLGEQPLGDQVADDVGDGHPGQPAGAGQVGPAGRSVAEQQLQQQRPVVATGVLRKVPARGAQRPANRCGGRRHVC